MFYYNFTIIIFIIVTLVTSNVVTPLVSLLPAKWFEEEISQSHGGGKTTKCYYYFFFIILDRCRPSVVAILIRPLKVTGSPEWLRLSVLHGHDVIVTSLAPCNQLCCLNAAHRVCSCTGPRPFNTRTLYTLHTRTDA